MRSTLLAVALLAGLCLAAPLTPAVVTPAPHYHCQTFVVDDAAAVSPSAAVAFTLSLQQRNIEILERTVLDVSDPDSPRYGQYLSSAEVEELTRPAQHHVDAVTAWLDANGIRYTVRAENVHVESTVAQASALLDTTFRTVTHRETRKSVIRAGDYALPASVAEAVAAVFGLHGAPVPRPSVVRNQPRAGAGDPAAVTPKVLYETYSIGGVTVNRNDQNIQAVAEFQDQFMAKEDLEAFFKAEVPSAQTGDDQISKFVGSPYQKGGSPEADLDTQFMMGIAVGVKTQFWEFPNNDFCGDLHNYTATMLATAAPPLVNSISYGWQGDLSQVGCQPADLAAVDANFAKLAAKGISVMISSGDSGSGYAPKGCDPSNPGKTGIAITQGTVAQTLNGEAVECCQVAQQQNAKGWTWTPPSREMMAREMHLLRTARAAAGQPVDFSNTVYSCRFSESTFFPQRDVYTLDGALTPIGGIISMVNANGTLANAKITFSAPDKVSAQETTRNVSASFRMAAGGKHEHFTGKALFLNGDSTPVQIEWVDAFKHSTAAVWVMGPNPPPPPPQGTCKIYSSVTSTGKAPSTTISGGPAITPGPSVPQLYASWPAGSPWVTAVGATRFIDQKVGNGEMASDQFGSGGGFSTRFNQTTATWQKDAVAAYVAQGGSLAKFPPQGAFNPLGRATPDVSALGEGYQVYISGQVEPVGGTSASSPMFAGLISLINEKRIAAGKPVMGFLNPFLYKNADAFYDVTQGTNAISRSGGEVPYGWAAAKGWDAATGLGTPHFDKLLTAAMATVEGRD